MGAGSPQNLAERLRYSFIDLRHLELACIHKSFGNEQRSSVPVAARNNERYEFLGDAVLDLVISRMLLDEYPQCTEGNLSKLRAAIVNEKNLANVARDLGVGEFILLGKGEALTGGHEKDSILSGVLEAIVAAIFLDGGFSAIDQWVNTIFADQVKSFANGGDSQDYKTRLQEVIQAKYRAAPRYEVVESIGPDHAKLFRVELLINGAVVASAVGRSKKEAEQGAARAAFEQYGAEVKLAGIDEK